jgi:hypothetical protein
MVTDGEGAASDVSASFVLHGFELAAQAQSI